jgi:hypothetical protein
MYDGDCAYFTSARGYVDWFEVGVSGVVTRYDLGVVPEPGSLALFSFGLSLLAFRRRKEFWSPDVSETRLLAGSFC